MLKNPPFRIRADQYRHLDMPLLTLIETSLFEQTNETCYL